MKIAKLKLPTSLQEISIKEALLDDNYISSGLVISLDLEEE